MSMRIKSKKVGVELNDWPSKTVGNRARVTTAHAGNDGIAMD